MFIVVRKKNVENRKKIILVNQMMKKEIKVKILIEKKGFK